MSDETFSVLIATYRRSAMLKAAVESILGQSRPAQEIVIACWSEDGPSLAAATELADQVVPRPSPNIRVVTTRENTVTAKENAALAVATGAIVCFLDDDAVAHADWLERMARHYRDPSVGGVGGRDVIKTGKAAGPRTVRSVGRAYWFGRLVGNHHEDVAGIRDVDFLKGVNMSFRRRLLEPIDPRLVGEIPYGFEIDLGLAVRAQGSRVVYDPQLQVDHFSTSDMSPANRALAYVSNHNQTYILLKRLPGWGRIAFLVYTFLLGDRNTIGALRVPLLLLEGWPWSSAAAHFRGKVAGVRSFARRRGPGRILLYSWPFAPQVGGLERLTEQTARRLAARGSEVSVVTDTPAGAPSTEPDRSFAVVRRPSLARLGRLVWQADLVQLNGFDLAVFGLALILRRPIVWQHIDYDTVDPRGLCSRYGRSCRFSLRRCWTCLRSDHSRLGTGRVLASFLAKTVAARCVRTNLVAADYALRRLSLPRSQVVPLGVDAGSFTPAARGGAVRPFTVLFVGRHLVTKGCDLLVRAVSLCRARGLDVHVVIVGDGPHRAATEQLTRDLDLVEFSDFTGRLLDAELIRRIQAADAVVVPSSVDEYYGFTALEAMSCGVPVIAARVGGLPEVLGDGGLLFEPGEVVGLADQIAALVQSPALRARLGQCARARAETALSEDTMIDRYVAVYRQISGVAA